MKKSHKRILIVSSVLVLCGLIFCIVNLNEKKIDRKIVSFKLSYSTMMPGSSELYIWYPMSSDYINEEINKIIKEYKVEDWIDDYNKYEFKNALKLIRNGDWDALAFICSGFIVFDGGSFRVEIVYDDGTVIKSTGSGNFPEGYFECKEAVSKLLVNQSLLRGN